MSKITVDAKDLVFRVPISKYAELMNGLDQAALQYKEAKANPEKIEAWTKAIGLLNRHLRDYIKNRFNDSFWKDRALAKGNEKIEPLFWPPTTSSNAKINKLDAPIRLLADLIAALENVSLGRASPILGITSKRTPVEFQARLGSACAIIDFFVMHKLKNESDAAAEVINVARRRGIELWHKKSSKDEVKRLLSFRAKLRTVVSPKHNDWKHLSMARECYEDFRDLMKRETADKPLKTVEARAVAKKILNDIWGEQLRTK